MDKQKVRPLDEERDSRSLLSNVVVILHLILGTLPILLVVWAVDKLINGTLPPIIVWGIGGIMILFLKKGSEPVALIGAWFSFTTVELWNLAKIKRHKIDKEI